MARFKLFLKRILICSWKKHENKLFFRNGTLYERCFRCRKKREAL